MAHARSAKAKLTRIARRIAEFGDSPRRVHAFFAVTLDQRSVVRDDLAMGAPNLSVVSKTLPDPPYPADTRAKGWRFELDYERINQSSTWALAGQQGIRAWLLALWYQAWQESPMGTLPDDDTIIAAKINMPLPMFQAHRAVLMRGWKRCSDGLLYHETITERVLIVIAMRAGEKRRQAEHRAKRKPTTVTRDTTVTNAESRVNTPPEPEPIKSNASPSANAEGESTAKAADPCPDCPHQKIVDAWHEILPTLQGVATWEGERERDLRSRWRARWKGGKYTTEEAGIAYWRRVFKSVGECAFLMGANDRGWTATLPWLVKASNFAKVIDGNYKNRGRA